MPVAIRAIQPKDIHTLDHWARAIGIDDFMSRSRPRHANGASHDPTRGVFWFVIVDDGVDVGTVWLEPGELDESILGIYLGDQSAFGRGIGCQSIRLAVSQCWTFYPAHNITLNVRQANPRAIACYKKVGFSITSSGTKISPSGHPIPFFQMQLQPGPRSADPPVNLDSATVGGSHFPLP